MGFYHPATVVKDAQRQGVPLRAIDVTRSAWKCTLEDGAVRLGLRYVQGRRAEAAERLVAARPLGSVAEAAQRAELTRSELETLAHAGAFAAFGLARREALWQAAAVERDSASLLARARPQAAGAPLPPMTPCEETAADYAATRLTAGPHVMAHLRSRLAADGVLAATYACAAAMPDSCIPATRRCDRRRGGQARRLLTAPAWSLTPAGGGVPGRPSGSSSPSRSRSGSAPPGPPPPCAPAVTTSTGTARRCRAPAATCSSPPARSAPPTASRASRAPPRGSSSPRRAR